VSTPALLYELHPYIRGLLLIVYETVNTQLVLSCVYKTVPT